MVTPGKSMVMESCTSGTEAEEDTGPTEADLKYEETQRQIHGDFMRKTFAFATPLEQMRRQAHATAAAKKVHPLLGDLDAHHGHGRQGSKGSMGRHVSKGVEDGEHIVRDRARHPAAAQRAAPNAKVRVHAIGIELLGITCRCPGAT